MTDVNTSVPLISKTTVRRGPLPKTERNNAFAAAYNAGATKEELSALFGLKPNTVDQYIMKLRKWGLITRLPVTRRGINEERNRLIVEKHNAGLSKVELSKEFNLSTMQIRNIIQEAEAKKMSPVAANPVLYPGVPLHILQEVRAGGIDAMREHYDEIMSSFWAALSVYERTSQRPAAR
jgi:transposase